jgi:hypothetical protein
MKTRLLLTTAVGLVFATAAFAQSPKDTQTQTPSTTAPAAQKAPDTSTRQTPANSSSTAAPSTGSQAQTAPSTSSQTGGTSAPAQAQTNAPPASNNQAQQAPASGSSTTTAQQPAQPANPPTNTAQQPAQPANPATNTAQQPAQSTNPPTNTAQQPANPPTNTAQSSSTNQNASVHINDQQRTRVTQAISRLNVQPVTNVNFSLSVGTVVPRDVRLQTLPPEVAEVVPQYRGYSFFVVRDEIVIVEPSTSKIVTVLPRSGSNTAAAPAPSRTKHAFTDRDREVVRKHVNARTERQTTERPTTGSTAKTVIRRGERLPDSVEVEEFPETVYREAPALREYRYLHRDNHTYIVDPTERTVIEDFD